MGQQVMLTRQVLEECVRTYKHEKASYFMTTDRVTSKQINNAISRFAPKVRPGDVVALMDTTLFNSGKDGFLITQTHMYGKSMGGKTIDLNAVSRITRKDSYLTVFYPDGSTETHYVSIFDQDIFNLLKMIMEASERLNEKPAAPDLSVLDEIMDAINAAEPDVNMGLEEEPPSLDPEIKSTPGQEPKPAEEESGITPTPAFDPIDEADEEPDEVPQDVPEPQAKGDADALFAQGQKLFMAKDYAAAISAFQKAADLGHQQAAQFLKQLKAITGNGS